MEVLHQLVRVVARSFYDDKYIVIFDTIVRETMVPDDILIDRMQIVIRDLNRILAHLVKDRLIKCETKQQPKADGKIISRNYFYFDYKQFVDIVKYRIYRMRQSVEEMIKREMESKGYICPACNAIFNSLDVSRLLNSRTGTFDCDVCTDSELQAYDPMISQTASTGKSGNGPHELHSRLMEQTKFIVELLKEADKISIPAFNPVLWLDQHAAKYSLLVDDGEEDRGPQLAIAGANSSEAQINVSVELADEETLRGSTAATSATSNPLPEWHMYSTVTGEAIRSTERTITSTAPIKDNDVIDSDDQDDIVNYYTQMADEEDIIREKAEVEEQKQSSSKLAKLDIVTVMVMVAGKPVPLDQVTEDDKDKMTEEEYTKYYECRCNHPGLFMTRHSKNNTTAGSFTYAERQKLKYGSQTARCSKDNLRPWTHCHLCLKEAVDPNACPAGHISCRQCVLEDILTQKAQFRANQAEEEQRILEAEKNRIEAVEVKRAADVKEFMVQQQATSGKRSHSEISKDSKALTANITITPSKTINSQSLKFQACCKAGTDGSHPISLKTLIPVHIQPGCPTCLKPFNSTSKARLAVKCGHVACDSCYVKLGGKKCLVCEGTVDEMVIVLESEGTGFAAGGGLLETKRYDLPFQ